MYELSQSWATRRYFWAVDTVSDFSFSLRLNDNVRGIDPHQKTVLSDDFGIGMAGLVMEQLFGAPWFVDVSIALNDPDKFKAIQKTGDPSPDYLFYDNAGRMFVVECKGCQSSPSYVREQILRGLRQLPSISFESDPRSVTYIVIATHLGRKTTTVYVVDPPYEGHSPSDRGEA
jgi:hypothetical protein